MANVGYALRSYLLTGTPVTSLVGQRIYPRALKQNATLPAIVYHKISTRYEHHISDVTRLAHSRIEFRCYATTDVVANQVAKSVMRSGICGFRGVVDGVTFCGTEIDSGEEDGEESPTDGNQTHRYVTTFDLMVHYKEAE